VSVWQPITSIRQFQSDNFRPYVNTISVRMRCLRERILAGANHAAHWSTNFRYLVRLGTCN
jgi:hypothetical protein